MYGFAYWSDDPDGYQLYIFHSPGSGEQMLHKMNTENGDTMFVARLEPEEGGSAAGAIITSSFDPYSTVFLNISNDASTDRIDMWQVAGNSSWFSVEPVAGELEAEHVQDFNLTFNCAELDTILYEGFLLFRHNALDFINVIDLSLNVVGERPPTPFGLVSPADGDTINPVEEAHILFEWEPSFDYNQDEISYMLLIDIDDNAYIYQMESTTYELAIDSLLDSIEGSIDISAVWEARATAGGDTTTCDAPFSLRLYYREDSVGEEPVPVEFGLQSIYPSPFNSQTTIRFGADRHEDIRLKVYDLAGREIIRLIDGKPAIGYQQIVWDAGEFPSGIYIVQLEASERIQNAKVALIR